MDCMKKYLYLFITCCFVIASYALHLGATEEKLEGKTTGVEKDTSQQEQITTQNQPRISFDSTHYNAGELWEGSKISHTFIIKNTGTAQLTIEKVKAG